MSLQFNIKYNWANEFVQTNKKTLAIFIDICVNPSRQYLRYSNIITEIFININTLPTD